MYLFSKNKSIRRPANNYKYLYFWILIVSIDAYEKQQLKMYYISGVNGLKKPLEIKCL